MADSLGATRLGLGSFARNQELLEKLTERLATGRRVNRAADDPAGLAIGAELAAEGKMLRVGRANIGQGHAVLQIANGALSTQRELLSRAGELAVQAANGILSDQDRATLNREFRSVVEEIHRIGSTTRFGELNLLGDNQPSETRIQVGTRAGPASSIDISVGPSTADSLGAINDASGERVTLNELDISTSAGANRALEILGGSLDQLAANRATVGAASNRLKAADRGTAAAIESTEGAHSRLMDLDVPRAASTLETAQALGRLGTKALSIQIQQGGAILDLLA